MNQQPTRPTNAAPVRQPTTEALQAAINRHVARSADTVSRIPHQSRTIVSKSEVQNRAAGAVIRGQA